MGKGVTWPYSTVSFDGAIGIRPRTRDEFEASGVYIHALLPRIRLVYLQCANSLVC